MINYRIKDGFHIILPEWEEPAELRWLNGVPFGGERTDAKEVYMEQKMEYDRRCPECLGLGEVEVMVKESFASQRIDPRYEKQTCDKCNGEGWIEE